MKILHVSSAPSSSGAGRAAWNTHRALRNLGFDSRLFYLVPDPKADADDKVFNFEESAGVGSRLRRLLVTSLDRLPLILYPSRSEDIFSPGWIGQSLKNTEHFKWADLIHIHWSNHGFVNISEIAEWEKPVVWTLRDMWAFTGGCHYTKECQKYITKCGSCPSLNSSTANDMSTSIHGRKMEHLRSASITWIAISSWIKEKAEKSAILEGKVIEVIQSGVSSSVFKSEDKLTCRSHLNLNPSANIVLVGATNLRESFKGFDFVVKSLNKLSTLVEVVTFGDQTFSEGEIPQTVRHFGRVDEAVLHRLYNSADLFLAPSIAEAMGKAHLEAQMCGTPVVCFNGTGPADIVEQKKTGYLADFMNLESLVEGIEFCLEHPLDKEKIMSNARQFDIEVVSQKYISIYEETLLGWTDRSRR